MDRYFVIIRTADTYASEHKFELEATGNKDAELRAVQHFALDMGRVHIITQILVCSMFEEEQ